jgi:hypothetical protein
VDSISGDVLHQNIDFPKQNRGHAQGDYPLWDINTKERAGMFPAR